MSASLYLQNAWLNHVFGNGAPWAQPAGWWVQLHHDDPGASCTLHAYGPRARGPGDTPILWHAAAAQSNHNDVSITWVDLPDPGADDEIQWVSIWDAASGGNPLTYGQMTGLITVTEHSNVTMNIGDLVNTVS